MSGLFENGWCGSAFGGEVDGSGRIMLGRIEFRRQGWGTNVDNMMLVVLVERGGAFVVWCGDGDIPHEISRRSASSRGGAGWD